jgi:hypothetical protein
MAGAEELPLAFDAFVARVSTALTAMRRRYHAVSASARKYGTSGLTVFHIHAFDPIPHSIEARTIEAIRRQAPFGGSR